MCEYQFSLNQSRMDGFADVKGIAIGFKFRKSDEPDGGYHFYTFEHPGMVLRFSLLYLSCSNYKYVPMSSLRSQ